MGRNGTLNGLTGSPKARLTVAVTSDVHDLDASSLIFNPSRFSVFTRLLSDVIQRRST